MNRKKHIWLIRFLVLAIVLGLCMGLLMENLLAALIYSIAAAVCLGIPMDAAERWAGEKREDTHGVV